MGIVSSLATLLLPFISITISFCTAFVILVWFTLTIIYAITEIINLLLGQPLVGWLITGDISATNDVRNLFSNNMFSFTSPIMMFLYVGLAVSLFMFLVYFLFQIFEFKTIDNFSLSSSVFSFCLIIFSLIWIPFLYSMLVLVTASLMTGLTSLLNLARLNNSQANNFDLESTKTSLINNLFKLKNLKEQGQFLFIDIEKPEIQEWIKKRLSYQETISFNTLVQNWNNLLTDSNLSKDKLDNWINILNAIDTKDISKLTQDQKNLLTELGSFSQTLNLLNTHYDAIFSKILSIDELKEFNKWFIQSDSIDFESFRLNHKIFNLNNLEKNMTIEGFAFYILNNKIVFSNKFSQNLVNILYSLALGKNAVFVPGWSNDVVEQSWNLFWVIPWEMKTLGVNITAYLFYNVKVILIGSLINSVLISALIIFALILLKRFVYIAMWPIYMLFLLARSSGQGSLSFAKLGINELFYKFINILVFSLLWNFICLLTSSVFAAINEVNPYDLFNNEVWIIDVFKLFVIIGIIISGFNLTADILQKLSEEKSGASSGASEIARAGSKSSAEASKLKKKSYQSTKQVGKSINKRWNGGGRDAWTNSKGQGFKVRTTSTAKAMFNYKRG